MARDTAAQCKQCRREGQKLFLKGERCFTDKCGVERRSYPPGEHGRGRMRAVRVPGAAAREAEDTPLLPGAREAVPRLLRQGLAPGRRHRREPAAAARVAASTTSSCGSASPPRGARPASWSATATGLVNGRRVDIPSYQVQPDDVISIKPNSARHRRGPRGDRADVGRAGLAAGRPRLAHRQGPAPPRARARSRRRSRSSSSSSCTRSSRPQITNTRTRRKQ